MENHLEHHGILGQKWGVRNGTSYPLKPSDYSSAERKALKKYDKVQDAKNKYNVYSKRYDDRMRPSDAFSAEEYKNKIVPRKTKSFEKQMLKLTPEEQKRIRNLLSRYENVDMKELSPQAIKDGRDYYREVLLNQFMFGPIIGTISTFGYDELVAYGNRKDRNRKKNGGP